MHLQLIYFKCDILMEVLSDICWLLGPGREIFLQIMIRPICEQAGQLVSWSAGQLVSAFDDISIL